MVSSFVKRHRTYCALAMLAAVGSVQADVLQYLGQQIVPSSQLFNGTTVGGLSGIDRLPASGNYLAISDDRSAINPARFYELRLDLSSFVRSADPGSAGVSFVGVTTIQQPGGSAFAPNTVDPESLRVNPGNGNLIWSNEGQRGGAGMPALQNPTIREMTPAGEYLRDYAVPAYFNPTGTGANDPGIRNNLAFESLTVSTDGRTLYTATENALVQDGTASSDTTGSPARILSFDLASGIAGREFVYHVDPVALPSSPAGGFATNGLVELLAIGDRQFIAVERSFAAGAASPGNGPFGPTGNTIKLYRVDAVGATDVSGLDSLANASFTAASKTLLLNLSDLQNDDGSPLALDNIEGITWGPDLNGKRTLILVSDNNFGATQFTQFVALSVSAPIPEPASLSLMLLGIGCIARRRATAARQDRAAKSRAPIH